MNKLIITIALCVAFVSESFMFVYSKTLQRSADDLVKIRVQEQTDEQKSKDCVNQGGKVTTNNMGKYYRCDFNK